MKIVRMSKVHGGKGIDVDGHPYRSFYDVNTNLTLPSIETSH